jgi:hypothetical protein
MFEHLDRLLQTSPDGALTSAAINTFTFDGRPIRLIVQTDPTSTGASRSPWSRDRD